MRQLMPTPIDPIDPATVYADHPRAEGRPAVRLSMVASLDGATAVEGLSGGLSGPADHQVLAVLRSLADVMLVAAGTVREEWHEATPLPLAIVTRSCRLDLDAPVFTAAKSRPVIFTVRAAPAAARERAAQVADVVLAGESHVDLARAIGELGARGHTAVLAEGGPTLNAQLVRAGLVDELCLTVAPLLAAGESRRILAGPPLSTPDRFAPVSVCEEDGFLFLRLRPLSTPSSPATAFHGATAAAGNGSP